MRIEKPAVLAAATGLLAINPTASTQAIAAAAGISRASLHRLFPTRDTLIEELGMLVVARVRAAMVAARLDDGPPLAALARFVDACVPIVNEFAFLVAETQLERSARIVAAAREMDEEVERLLRRGQEEGVFRVDLPTRWLGYALEGLLVAAAEANRRGEIAPRDASRLVLESFVGGAARARPPVGAPGPRSSTPAGTTGASDERRAR
jgi:AcrR family transcriptional regulator